MCMSSCFYVVILYVVGIPPPSPVFLTLSGQQNRLI